MIIAVDLGMVTCRVFKLKAMSKVSISYLDEVKNGNIQIEKESICIEGNKI